MTSIAEISDAVPPIETAAAVLGEILIELMDSARRPPSE